MRKPFGRVQSAITARHGFHSRGIEEQALETGSIEARGPRRRHVAFIGRQDLRLARTQCGGHGVQCLVTPCAIGRGERTLRRDRVAAELLHRLGKVSVGGHVNTRSSRWISSSRPRYPRIDSSSWLRRLLARRASSLE
jgi:hypothetical protein